MNLTDEQSQLASKLGFQSFRKRCSGMGLDLSFCLRGAAEVHGLAPTTQFCWRVSQAGCHCSAFLSRLADDAADDPAVRWGSCMPGAFTVVAPLEAGPVVLGCFVTDAVANSEAVPRLLCDLELDRDDVLSTIDQDIRYRDGDAPLLAGVLANIAEDWYTGTTEHLREVEMLSQGLAETYEELSFIYRLNSTLNVTAKPEDYFHNLADELAELLGVSATLIVLAPGSLGPEKRDSTVIHSGSPLQGVEEIIDTIDPRAFDEQSCHIRKPQHGQDDLGQMLLAPIRRGDNRFGTLIAVRPLDNRDFDNIDMTRLASVANSVAVFLENFRLYGSLQQLFLGSLKALTSSIDAKDPYTCGHSERVAVISRKIVEQMRLPTDEGERVYLCGLLHDIGKIGVPEAVLGKPGRLTDDEHDVIKRHPITGARIISGIKEMEDVVPAVLHHHERIDGGGYPDGLTGDQIPFRARVLCVADSLDAMTSARPYRDAMSISVAEQEILDGSGTQFDPAVVTALFEMDIRELIPELRRIRGGRILDYTSQPEEVTAV